MTLYVFRNCALDPEDNNLLQEHRQHLLDLFTQYGYMYHHDGILLSSGERSNHYVDCRNVLGREHALTYASTTLSCLIDKSVEAYGGVATGGISLASTLSYKSSTDGLSKPWFYVRPSAKMHGLQNLIEGYAPPLSKIILLEDVITSGKSILNAIKTCEEHGLQVVEIASLVVRSPDGISAMEKVLGVNFPIKTLFLLDEIYENFISK